MLKLIPREETFFDLFDTSAKVALTSSRLLRDLVEDYRDVEARVKKIRDNEHEGDQVTHEIMDKLNRTFVTPLDREDIHSLAYCLDDISDSIELAADRMILYKIEKPTPITLSLVRILVRCCEEINAAIPLLRDRKRYGEILEHGIEINRLENEGDALSRAALAKLFENPENVFDVIRWKEVYEVIEDAIDLTEDVADRLHGMVIKNG